jgi:hypothetical protein
VGGIGQHRLNKNVKHARLDVKLREVGLAAPGQQRMHSFATGSCQGVGRHGQPTGLVERNTKIIVLRLPCNLTATIQQLEATRHASAGPSEHNDASLVRGQVDFHIKNSAKDREYIQQPLHLHRIRADQRDIVGVHDVRDTQTAQDWRCTTELQLDHVMQQLNEKAK